MRSREADAIKAQAIRSLLTCRCSHQQTEHLHSMREGMVVGRWLQCMAQGCRCQAFISCLTAREYSNIGNEVERRVEVATVAAVMANQPAKPLENRTPQFPSSPAVRWPKARGKRPKERVVSANDAGVSSAYSGTPRKLPGEKYVWEEL